jgi:simple sugar transport system permease protein/ribose transport system permease protein
MLYILRGCIFVVTNGTPISQFPNPNDWFFSLGISIGGVFPVQIIVMVIFVVGMGLLLKKGTLGFKFFAVGGNQKAAHLTGINVDKVKLAAFVITGFCCAWAAIIALAYMKSVHPTIGTGREMDVIAAVIIGGTNLYGGRGTAVGTLIGAAIMGVVRNGMVMLGVQAFYQTAFIGVFILIAVVADIWLKGSGRSVRRLKNT